jgi:endonuclease/exonuclease/phosphatase family metal-dependent hydrolase
MNVYYGQVVSPDGEPMTPAIDVSAYADLFTAGADVVAMQEAVLTRLPRGHPLANTPESYAARDGAGQSYWKAWTKRFPPSLFRGWWRDMTRLAAEHGYRPVPPGGCGESASMYAQRFGNAFFVHTRRLLDLGLGEPLATCVPALLGQDLAQYAGETEDRNAILLDLGGVLLVNTHLSEKDTRSAATGRSTQHDMMARVLREIGDRPAVIVGDFNKSDPKTVPPQVARLYTVAFDPKRDRDVYDLLRRSGFACLPNDRATAWNARHPDQVCSNSTDAAALRKSVRVLMPISSSGSVISDHAALAFSLPTGNKVATRPGRDKTN